MEKITSAHLLLIRKSPGLPLEAKMPASFLDLPVEVMLRITEHIKDVCTIKSMLSIKNVRHQLTKHIKIVLDFPWKKPQMFRFDDAFEVIRTADLKDFAPKKFIYLVEIDMSQKSFHSDKFYPDSNGVYAELQEVLRGYSGPNVFLCLTIVSPLEDLPKEIHMLMPKATFIEIFQSLEFRSIHIKPSADYNSSGQIRWPAHGITFDAMVSSDVDFFIKNSKMKNPNQVPTLESSTSSTVWKFIRTARSIGSPFIVSSRPLPKPKLPPGELFELRWFCWNLEHAHWRDCKEMSLGTLGVVNDCTIEMAHGPIEIPEISSFKDFKWDLKLKMARSSTTQNEKTYSLPSITNLHSKSLSSLSITSDNDFPSLTDVSLPNLSALSLAFEPNESTENIDAISLEVFRRSAIQYLSVNNLLLLKKSTFSPNLSHLEGIEIKTSLELGEFNALPFPHLKSLAITTQISGEVLTNAPKLQQLNWTSKSEVSWGLDLLKKFTKLKSLDIKADEFKDCGRPFFPELLTLRIEYLPAMSNLKGQEKGNIAEVSKWMPISAPKLESFTFVYDPTRATDHAFLFLTSLPSLKKITFGNAKIVQVNDSPKLTDLVQLRNSTTKVTKITCNAKVPSLRFISCKDDNVTYVLGDDMSPVFIKSSTPGSNDPIRVWASLDQDAKPSLNSYTDAAVVIGKYKDSVAGLEEWVSN